MSKPLRARSTACVCAAVSGAPASFGARPFDFLRLLLPSLLPSSGLCHSLEDLLRVVTEGEWCHARRGGEKTARERLPLFQNGLRVMLDKFREPHVCPLVGKMPQLERLSTRI